MNTRKIRLTGQTLPHVVPQSQTPHSRGRAHSRWQPFSHYYYLPNAHGKAHGSSEHTMAFPAPSSTQFHTATLNTNMAPYKSIGHSLLPPAGGSRDSPQVCQANAASRSPTGRLVFPALYILIFLLYLKLLKKSTLKCILPSTKYTL